MLFLKLLQARVKNFNDIFVSYSLFASIKGIDYQKPSVFTIFVIPYTTSNSKSHGNSAIQIALVLTNSQGYTIKAYGKMALLLSRC